jgi:hypothetical protein
LGKGDILPLPIKVELLLLPIVFDWNLMKHTKGFYQVDAQLAFFQRPILMSNTHCLPFVPIEPTLRHFAVFNAADVLMRIPEK